LEKRSYEQFNKYINKHIVVNQLQNTALKWIIELRFIDLIRNKLESIAKKQINELKENKKVWGRIKSRGCPLDLS